MTDRHVEESLKTNLKQVVERRTQKISNTGNGYDLNQVIKNRKSKIRDPAMKKSRVNKNDTTPTPGGIKRRGTSSEKAKRDSTKSDFNDFSQFAEKNVVFINGKAL